MDLSELIAAAQGTRSLKDLARISDRTDNPLTYSRWQQLASGSRAMRAFPDPDTLRTVSAVLGIPLRVVVLAAAESVGLDVADRDSNLARMLPSSARNLSDRQVIAVLSVVQAFLDATTQTGTDEEHFTLPDVTAPNPPREPSAAERLSERRASGHGG